MQRLQLLREVAKVAPCRHGADCGRTPERQAQTVPGHRPAVAIDEGIH